MDTPLLLIGNKNYSSWSLRPWLALKKAGVDFRERKLPLYQAGTKAEILKYSPSGKVPMYQEGDLRIWDSLAICEYVAESHPALWPSDLAERAVARSIAAEMHSGFPGVRNQLPMNCRASGRRVDLFPDTQSEIQRIQEIWNQCRRDHGEAGDWLFGQFTIVDAMFAPVVSRFHTYRIPLDATCAAYVAFVLADPHMASWFAEAAEETEVLVAVEVGMEPAQ